MDAKTQIIALIISFIYGIFFYITWKLNEWIIKNKKRRYRSIISILYMYVIVLLYIITIFKINNGKFHIYFFILLYLGFFTGIKLLKKVSINDKLRNFLDKRKKKWYTVENRGDTHEKKSH